MRVLLVRPTASGGLAAHVQQELELLVAGGWDVGEATVRIQERPRPLADLRTVRTLREQLRTADQPVTVHAHGLRAGALVALAMPRGGAHRLVVTLHNRTVGSLPTRTVGALLLRVLARRAEIVLAVSPDLAEDARRAGARDVRHAVIPAPERSANADSAEESGSAEASEGSGGSGSSGRAEGAEGAEAPEHSASESHEGEESPDGRLEVLVVARLAPQKGLHDLLDAVRLLPRDQPVRFRIAGDGPLHAELAARIRAEQLPVELLGRREDVPALLAAAELYVSAARWEGQPVSLQEVLHAGRAIVATDAGGTRWVTGEAAELVPVGDAPALAAAITALRDPMARRAAEAASRERARELPTAEDLLTQLGEVLAPVRPPLVN